MVTRVARVLLWAVVLAPPIFLLFAVQHGAITVPFWDHCELITSFAKLYDGTLQPSDLWASHNHTRPLTYRALLLANGWLTDWDLRSEYIYLYAAILGAFLLLARALRRVVGDWSTPSALAALAALSITAFSPVGHNNHWWSMMVQLDLAHLFIAGALVTVAASPTSWPGNAAAALWCWLAAYTITNGLMAFAACGLVAQLATRSWWPRRVTWFWAANAVIVAALYFPGLREASSRQAPTLLAWLTFALGYLGAPLAGLVRFPFAGMFDIPRAIGVNVAVGACLCVAFLAGLWMLVRHRETDSTPGLLFAGFGALALASAVVTGWGRAAFDDFGVAAANGSRYVIYSSYLVYALIFLGAGVASGRVGRDVSRHIGPAARPAAAVAFALFVLVAGRTYAQATTVYREAHEFNRSLEAAYLSRTPDFRMYPDPATVRRFLDELQRLQIGPYRGGVRAPFRLRQLAGLERRDDFGINSLRHDAAIGTHLFAHPGSAFELPIEAGRHEIEVVVGIASGALDAQPPTDGVEFRITYLSGASPPLQLWSRTVRPVTRPEDRGRLDAALAFDAPLAGQLLFETLPLDTTANDWAYWGNVRVDGT